ncbi:hypothetical protein H4S02_002398 [Coemansia sp. RSA 2611]|nr:hypothetical protein H4S02_002398 [Coemansia sp. RSA 2611]
MALTEITQRANNRGGARQTTLFDSLGAAQRRHKRTRKAPGQENAHGENSPPDKAEQAAKRARTGDTAATDVQPQATLVTRPFTMLGVHAALRQRQRQALAPHSVAAGARLAALVSPAARAFRVAGDGAGALPLACKYGGAARLALVDEAGFVSVFDTRRGGALAPLQRWRAHDNAVFDVEWCGDGAQAVTASADETCRLWDVERELCLGTFAGHAQTVRAVSWRHGDAHCFASASRDGAIMAWDVRCNRTVAADGARAFRPVNVIARAHPAAAVPRARRPVAGASVTAVRHLRHNPCLLASAGSASEAVRFWDVRMRVASRASALPQPVAASLLPPAARRARGTSSLALDPDATRLYAACNDSAVYVHSALAPARPLARLAAPEFECRSFNVGTAMSPCGRHLAAGSSTGSVVVWELDRFGTNASGRRAVLQGHAKEAGCVAWNPDSTRLELATCGDDGILRVWHEDALLAESASRDPVNRCSWGFSRLACSPPAP